MVESARLRPAAHGLAEWKWAGPAPLECGQIIAIDQMKRAQADAAQPEPLPILRRALTYITETSKHNFRGLVLLPSAVILCFPLPPSFPQQRGHPPTPTPNSPPFSPPSSV